MARPANTANVMTNQRCNQACSYCNQRSATDDLRAIAFARVCAQIDAALAAGAIDIRLSGGEPTLRGDLERLVAHAKSAGAERISLETNGTLIDADRARALCTAGLTTARVNLVGSDERVDQVTRDPGGFQQTLLGLDALVAAGAGIEILCALTRSTQPLVGALPAFVAARLGTSLRAIEVAVPVDGPDPRELLSYAEAAIALQALDVACRAAAVSLRAMPGQAPPPCVFPPRSRMSHLYSFSPEAGKQAGFRQLPACERCLLNDRCSGISERYLARQAAPSLTPIVEDRLRRSLSLLGTVPEQIRRELVNRSLSGLPDGTPIYDEIIRINFHCNQACEFCFVSTHLPTAEDALVENAIRDGGARGSRIVLSGGEPTLHKRLVDFVRLAAEVSRHPVCLQTNAIRLDDPKLVAALVTAGLSQAFVSLHGATAEISDLITSAPNTFVRTVVGLDHLHEASVTIMLNFVICESNRHQIADTVRMIATRWPGATLNISFVAASTDLVPRTEELMPRYSAAMPQLSEAIDESVRLGLRIHGFESMCGIPLCLLPPSVGLETLMLTEIPADFDQGEFVRGRACADCGYQTRCYGIRRQYANLYGTDELRAISTAAT